MNSGDLFKYNKTDKGNADRFALLFKDQARFSRGNWYLWDGSRWAINKDGGAQRLAMRAAQILYERTGKLAADDDKRKWAAYAISSESNARLNATVALASVHKDIVEDFDQFDKDLELLNVKNGIVNLTTGAIEAHDPTKLLTRIAPVDYDPNHSENATWNTFLDDLTGNDEATKSFLQRVLGYCLLGNNSEEKVFLLHGPGGTGKSTLVEAVKAATGEYSVTFDFASITKYDRNPSGPREDIARLCGSRIAIASEVGPGQSFNEGTLKSLTGGDTIVARRMYRGTFEFIPQFTPILVANELIRTRSDDTGMWRRMVLIPLDRVVPEDRRTPKVKRYLLHNESAQKAILSWLIQGCLQYRRNRLAVPQSIKAATDAYRASNDTVQLFLADACDTGVEYEIRGGDLYAAYKVWSIENGHRPIANKAFAGSLIVKGFERVKRSDAVYWLQIKVAD